MSESPLEQRLRRLEDHEAIRDLTARYADAINKGWNGKHLDLDAITEIFAVDARWEGPQGEFTESADAIAAELPEATAMVEFSMHTFLNPIISVDGDTATGNWLMWIASIVAGDPRAVYMSAAMTYTRTDAGWRIQSIYVAYGAKLSAH